MNSIIQIQLGVDAPIAKRLERLQVEFAKACNFIVPIAQKNHCWNRVALHHLAYHAVRAAFSEIGSQMACNAVYAVCRSYRLLLQHPDSPYADKKIPEGALPLLGFLNTSPVFFDRHTLSLQNNQLSLFTLEGRLRFGIELCETDAQRFRTEKLREVQLVNQQNHYLLLLSFADAQAKERDLVQSDWPSYLVLTDQPTKHHDFVEEANAPSIAPQARSMQKAS